MIRCFRKGLYFVLGILLLAGVPGCGSDANPLAAFQPEIANNPDSFQFQVTGAVNVSTTVEYLWQNSGLRATINQSSAITSGSATLTLMGPDNVVCYSAPLSTNGTFQSDTSSAGTWKIRVTTTNLNGTVNFRVQKL